MKTTVFPSSRGSVLKKCRALVCAGMALAPLALPGAWLDITNPAFPFDLEPNDGGGDGSGSFFDLKADSNAQITGISAFSNTGDGNAYTIDIWYRIGTTVGNELSATDWALLESFSGTETDELTPELLSFTTPLNLAAGDMVGFAVQGTLGGLQWYDTDDPETYTDGTITVTVPDGNFSGANEAKGFDDLFNDTDRFRSFAGIVHYGTPTTAVPDTGSTMILLLTGVAGLFAGCRRLKS